MNKQRDHTDDVAISPGGAWKTAAHLFFYTALGVVGFFVPFWIFLDIELCVVTQLLGAGTNNAAEVLLWLLIVGAEGTLYTIGTLFIAVWLVREARPCHARMRRISPDTTTFWGTSVPLVLVPGLFLVFVFVAGYVFLFLDFCQPETGCTELRRFPPECLGSLNISGIRKHVFPGLVAGFAGAAMYVCALLAAAMNSSRLPVDEKIATYLRLKRQQDRFLVLAGAILALSMLAHAQLIRADNVDNAPWHQLSEGYVLLHAGFWSLALAVGFFIVRQPLRRVGQSLKEELTSPPRTAHAPFWIQHAEREQQVLALLQLKGLSLDSLKEVIAVLSPLLGAVIPSLLQ